MLCNITVNFYITDPDLTDEEIRTLSERLKCRIVRSERIYPALGVNVRGYDIHKSSINIEDINLLAEYKMQSLRGEEDINRSSST